MLILNEQDKLELRGVVRMVTNNFFVTPVSYQLGAEKLSRFNEDGDNYTHDTYNLNGMVTYGKSGGVNFSMQGAVDKSGVTVSLNVEDLITLGLYDTTQFRNKLKPEQDFMVINGQRYKVKDVSEDGPLDRQNILVIVTGELLIETT
jgi:hypothetical protein